MLWGGVHQDSGQCLPDAVCTERHKESRKVDERGDEKTSRPTCLSVVAEALQRQSEEPGAEGGTGDFGEVAPEDELTDDLT